MSDPRNIRLTLEEIERALEAYTREELQRMLGLLFKEYVVAGSAPAATGAGPLLETRTDLDGRSFAQVITWLQQHLDHPELALFEVEGERVSVRAQGRSLVLEAPRAERPEATPPPPVAAPAAPLVAGTITMAARPASPAPASAANPLAPTPAVPGAPAGSPAPATSAESGEAKQPDPDSRFARLEVD